MTAFILRTALFKTITLLIISVISFLIIHLAPGTPSQIDPLNPRFRKEDIARYRAAFDLDKPLWKQYFLFYKKFVTGELKSFKDNQPVLGKVLERFWNAAESPGRGGPVFEPAALRMRRCERFVRAYYEIDDPAVRKRLVEMIKTVARSKAGSGRK